MTLLRSGGVRLVRTPTSVELTLTAASSTGGANVTDRHTMDPACSALLHAE